MPLMCTGWAETIEQIFSYNSGCLVVIIRLLFNHSDALWLWHQRKRFVDVVYFKMALQRENRVKVTSSCGKRVSEVANLVRESRTRRAWARAKVSTDVQTVIERLLWILTACGIQFKAVLGHPCANMQGDLWLEQRLCKEQSLTWSQVPCHCGKTTAPSCYPRQAPWTLPHAR